MEEELPIDVGIRMEGDSVKFYSERSAEVENPIARRMLESFVEDEKKHLKDLLAMKSKSNLSRADRPEETIIVTRAKNAFEEVPDDVRKTLSSDPGDIELIGAAIRLEEEGKKYYLQAANSLPEGPEKNLFAWLAGEEEQHIFVLENTQTYLNSPADWFMGEEQWNFEGG